MGYLTQNGKKMEFFGLHFWCKENDHLREEKTQVKDSAGLGVQPLLVFPMQPACAPDTGQPLCL